MCIGAGRVRLVKTNMQKITVRVPAAVLGKRKRVTRYVPHSLNHRLHWSVRARWNAEWKDLVWRATLQERYKLAPLPIPVANVEVIFYVCHRMDRDNAYSAAKPIIDGLKVSGILTDDCEDHLELKVRTVKVEHIRDQGIELIIERLNGN